jgi:hypothetical protein
MKKVYRKSLKLLVVFVIFTQVLFGFLSPIYTAPRYEGKIYATVGIDSRGESDLHKLNEAAHYFGQTVIGWTKFPNFIFDLKSDSVFPQDLAFSAHMQERQNLLVTLRSGQASFSKEQLIAAKEYLQSKLDTYNQNSGTGFVLSNVDYESSNITPSYGFGAGITLLFTLLLWGIFVYIGREYRSIVNHNK